MPNYLRQIEARRWLSEPKKWLPAATATADEVTDLRSDDNALSVFLLPDTIPTAEERVAQALTAIKGKLADFEYYVVDDVALATLHLTPTKTPGQTRDSEVNDWHHDLVDLSAPKVSDLAATLRQLQFRRILKERLGAGIAAELKPGGRYHEVRGLNITDYLQKKGFIS